MSSGFLLTPDFNKACVCQNSIHHDSNSFIRYTHIGQNVVTLKSDADLNDAEHSRVASQNRLKPGYFISVVQWNIIYATAALLDKGQGSVLSCTGRIFYRNRAKWVNPFRPEFTIVIFIHYKPRIAVAILSTCSKWRWFNVVQIWKKITTYLYWFYGDFRPKLLGCRKIKSVFMDVRWCFNASWGLKGLSISLHELFFRCCCPIAYIFTLHSNALLQSRDCKQLTPFTFEP